MTGHDGHWPGDRTPSRISVCRCPILNMLKARPLRSTIRPQCSQRVGPGVIVVAVHVAQGQGRVRLQVRDPGVFLAHSAYAEREDANEEDCHDYYRSYGDIFCSRPAKVWDDNNSGIDGSIVWEGGVLNLSDERVKNIPCEIKRSHGINDLAYGVLRIHKIACRCRSSSCEWVDLRMAKWEDHAMSLLQLQ